MNKAPLRTFLGLIAMTALAVGLLLFLQSPRQAGNRQAHLAVPTKTVPAASSSVPDNEPATSSGIFAPPKSATPLLTLALRPPEPSLVAPTIQNAPSTRPTSTFTSTTVALADSPSVFEFELKDPQSPKTLLVDGIALTRDGKVLALKKYFTKDIHLVGASIQNRSVSCPGWLAQDKDSPWIVVKIAAPISRAVQLVDASYLTFKSQEILLVPLADGGSGNAARTVIPSSGPTDGPAINPEKELWISGDVSDFKPGLPVITRHGHLVGLVDEIRADLSLAHVVIASSPMPVLTQAASAERPLEWKEEKSGDDDIHPFTDAQIPALALDDVLQNLNGDALEKATRQLLARYAQSPAAWYAASLGYARAGKKDYAVASAQMLTQTAPKQWESWFLYGRQLEATGQYGKAVDAYQEATEHNPPVHRIGLPLAAALFKSGDHNGGLEALKQLVDKDPDYFDGWVALGEAHFAEKQIPDALKAYASAAALNPQSIATWESLATIYDGIHYWQGSAEVYVQLSFLTPRRADVWYNLGLALLKTKQPDFARTCFAKVKAINPQDADAARLLAQLDTAAKKGPLTPPASPATSE